MQKLIKIDKKYENFRWFFTSEGVLAVGGKSDEKNEIVIQRFLKPGYTVLHTSAPGSPFMIIQTDNPSEKDIEETAIFCACFSKQWKSGKKEIEVDVFKGEQIYKNKFMKAGTFGVKGKKKTIKVKPELVLVIQNGKLRAVPKTAVQNPRKVGKLKNKSFEEKEKKLAEIKQGKLTKEQAAEEIFKKIKNIYHFPFSKDEIMSAIPSDKIDVR